MAFKLTYSDGQESQHDDDTVWEIDDGVLKMGREKGKWSVLLSPSHWAVLELGGQSKDGDDAKAKDAEDKDADEEDESRDRDESQNESKKDKSDKDESDKDESDDDKD